jgi:ligand-binding SRPBCC domain-containing protein
MKFTHSSLINAPVDVVWRFHERPDIWQLLTPPWQPVQIVRRQGGLDIGAVTEFRLWIGFFPVTWIARHRECQQYKLFVDRQEFGPLYFWQHRHQFSEELGQTRLTDSIEYAIDQQGILDLFLGEWVNSRLKDMFRYRHQVTQKECQWLTQQGQQ